MQHQIVPAVAVGLFPVLSLLKNKKPGFLAHNKLILQCVISRRGAEMDFF